MEFMVIISIAKQLTSEPLDENSTKVSETEDMNFSKKQNTSLTLESLSLLCSDANLSELQRHAHILFSFLTLLPISSWFVVNLLWYVRFF